MILLDTSFLYALNDANDRNHERTVKFLRLLNDSLYLPASVLPELCYLLHSRLGHHVMRRFLARLATSHLQIVETGQADMNRIAELLEQYADAQLDYTDASIITLAERLSITRIATYDRRDYTMVRPRHCSYFDLLPER